METLSPQKEKRKKPGLKAAKKVAQSQGVVWALLSKAEKTNRRLLARAEKGSEKAARRLAKRLGVAAPTAATAPAPAAPDSTLLKTILPGPDRDAAAGALAAIKSALARPSSGFGGWRP